MHYKRYAQLMAVILAETISTGFYGVEAHTSVMTESEIVTEAETDKEVESETVIESETKVESETEAVCMFIRHY